jgi:hypothetical protein
MKHLAYLFLLAMACQPGNPQPPARAASQGAPTCVPVAYDWHGEKRRGELCILILHDDTIVTTQSLWYLADSAGLNRPVGSSFGGQGNFPLGIYGASFSENGQFGALMMVGEGHPWVEVFRVADVLAQRDYRPLFTLNPYPGSIEVVGWQKNQLIVESEMPLERVKSDTANYFSIEDYELAEKGGSKFHQFAFDPLTKVTVKLPPK